jgi:formate hydrogenlyase transcriptional activator
MPEQRLALDSVYLSDLTAGQYRNLLDLAGLAVSHPTADALFPTLALRLRDSLNFDFVTLGLYDSATESIRLDTWKAGETQKRCESIPVRTCASGWAWKNQRSVLVQDLHTESKLPVSLESLRQLGVRTNYVFPVTTNRHKLGAIGFGSLHVIPKTKPTLELLRLSGAMIAQLLDTTLSADGPIVQADGVQTTSVVTPRPEQAPQDLDLASQVGQSEAFPEIVGNSAPLQELLRQVRTVAATDATVLL